MSLVGIQRKESILKKYYPAVISPILLFKEDDFSKSKVFESFIINSLKAEFFWRNPYKDEVDAILYYNKQTIPIEIKYRKIEIRGISKFMRDLNINKGYIISSEKESLIKKEGKVISIVPAYKFLFKGLNEK